MPFADLPDGRGKIWVPEKNGCRHKHPCPDCFSCQWCSDDRCNQCRIQRCKPQKKLLPVACHANLKPKK